MSNLKSRKAIQGKRVEQPLGRFRWAMNKMFEGPKRFSPLLNGSINALKNDFSAFGQDPT